ncbi:MAG: glycosyltransferase family 2 protein [Candidatus Komeilibacteria bacterium]|nr:glycosyltransferase family 2 protein [Candidatus Komeilibacteria bacterium]
MDISIIIVSWNVRDLLHRCLLSIEKDGARLSHEVIVVDNNSTDGSQDLVRARHPGAHLIALDSNRGFATGNNIGLRRARGRYVFFLNPDTEVVSGALAGLARYLDEHADVAMIAPMLTNPDGSYQEGQVRRDPHILPEILTVLKINHLTRSLAPFRAYYRADFDPTREQDVEQIMGAAMFVRRSAIDRIGAFDERFFLWFEEVDLCLRFRNAGERIRFVPSFRVVHHGGKSFSKRQPYERQLIHNRSRTYFFRKHHGPLQAWVLQALSPLGLLASYIYQLVFHGRS